MRIKQYISFDYAPFGSAIKTRAYSSGAYRYGFNGKEKDDEIFDDCYGFESRIMDTRIARWFTTDPKESEYPWQTTFAYYKNSPISTIDFLGEGDYYDNDGNHIGSDGKTCTVGTGKDQKEISDDVMFVTSNEIVEKWTKDGVTNWDKVAADEGSTAMGMGHNYFQKLSGLTSKEDFSSQGSMNAVAHAQRNRYSMMNRGGESATTDEVFNSFGGDRKRDLHSRMLNTRKKYKEYWSLTPEERNNYENLYTKKNYMVMAQKAVINAWLHPETDNTGGATGWHGRDVLKHYDGCRAFEDFQLNYGFQWSPKPIIGNGAKITQKEMPNKSGKNGQILYEVTAAHGSSIFYRKNPDKK